MLDNKAKCRTLNQHCAAEKAPYKDSLMNYCSNDSDRYKIPLSFKIYCQVSNNPFTVETSGSLLRSKYRDNDAIGMRLVNIIIYSLNNNWTLTSQTYKKRSRVFTCKGTGGGMTSFRRETRRIGTFTRNSIA